jgi:hypothetical protein
MLRQVPDTQHVASLYIFDFSIKYQPPMIHKCLLLFPQKNGGLQREHIEIDGS